MMRKTSSGFFLSHRFWRRLRNFLPGSLWSWVYSLRERFLSPIFIRDAIAAVASEKQDVFENDLGSEPDVPTLETLWSTHGAVGKGESGYGSIYSKIIRDLPPVSNVLEIGVLGGGSHRAWAALFPEASIFGLDIDPTYVIEDGRIRTYVADQLRVDQLLDVAQKMPNCFELVVDDGWHQPEAGLKSLSVFLPRLAPGGYFVVEDIDWSKYRRIWEKAMVGLADCYQVSFRVLDTDASRKAVGGPYGMVVIRRARG